MEGVMEERSSAQAGTPRSPAEILAELNRRYNDAEDAGDLSGRQQAYDELLALGARMMSDGQFHPKEMTQE